jgi:hypothetical protein
MRNISNSEVTGFLRCKKQYVYAYVENLAPKVTGSALDRGTIGHEAFQRYTEARLDGKSHDDSMRWADKVFTESMHAGNVETVLQTKSLFTNYMGYHEGWPEWRLLQPEQKYELKLTDEMTITLRYDTMVEVIRSGQRLIGDYKFTYDFWTPEDHQLNGQLPKYISVMNANGMKVDGGFLEEIRTRKLKAENQSNPKMAWRRTPYYPSNAKKINMMRQHIAAGLEIVEFRNLSEAEQKARAIPVLDKYGACKFCNFTSLCASELDGGNTDVAKATDFVPNTYGYNFEEEAALL